MPTTWEMTGRLVGGVLGCREKYGRSGQVADAHLRQGESARGVCLWVNNPRYSHISIHPIARRNEKKNLFPLCVRQDAEPYGHTVIFIPGLH